MLKFDCIQNILEECSVKLAVGVLWTMSVRDLQSFLSKIPVSFKNCTVLFSKKYSLSKTYFLVDPCSLMYLVFCQERIHVT